MIIERVFKHYHLCCGSGSGAAGFNDATALLGKLHGRFRCIGGVDVDPAACADFEMMTGTRATLLDLMDEIQYRAFHGSAPPRGWRPATPDDIWRSQGGETPDVVFMSCPCKGFSGLLSETASRLEKYRALNGLTERGLMLLLEANKHNPVPIILFENVPRIATRGRFFLDRIVALLRAYGYAVQETKHDCGEIGELGQSRYDATARAVTGSGQHDNGFNSVADPRPIESGTDQLESLPGPNEKVVCIIRSIDGTWHRPFTTLECAALQSMFDPEKYFTAPEVYWDLDGMSDSAKRERIGNAVPRASAKGMGTTILRCLLAAENGEAIALSGEPVWVQPVVLALAAGR